MGAPWYKKWWGVLLIILFLWPFFLTYWIWKRNWDKKARIAVIIAFWMFIWVIVASSSSQTGQKSLQEGYKAGKEADLNPSVSSSPISTPSPTSTPAPTNIATPSPTEPDQKPVASIQPTRESLLMDKSWQALDKIFSGRRGVDIQYNSESKYLFLTYGDKESMFFDESSMVEGFFATFVKYGMEVFQIDGVDKLEVTLRTTFLDSYGKEDLEDAITMDMHKDEFLKYDWDKLRFQPIYYQLDRSAAALYIHPAVLKKIDLDKLKLRY